MTVYNILVKMSLIAILVFYRSYCKSCCWIKYFATAIIRIVEFHKTELEPHTFEFILRHNACLQLALHSEGLYHGPTIWTISTVAARKSFLQKLSPPAARIPQQDVSMHHFTGWLLNLNPSLSVFQENVAKMQRNMLFSLYPHCKGFLLLAKMNDGINSFGFYSEIFQAQMRSCSRLHTCF